MIRVVLTLTCAGLLVSASAGISQAAPVAVNNPSFTGGTTTGWTGFNNYGAYPGNYLSNANDNLPSDGWTGYMRYDNSYLNQLLSETIDAGKIYRASVETAKANDSWGSGGGLELYAWDGSTESRLSFIRVNSANEWTDLAVQVSGAEIAPYAGQQLGIRLRGGNSDRAHFDNVVVEKLDPVATSFQSSASMTVPDFSFETTGSVNGSWAGGSPHVWDGAGWPMGAGSYGQNPTDGSRVGVNSAFQLLDDVFVEGARYTLTVDASLRGDQGPDPKVDSSAIMFYREDQHPLATNSGEPNVGILDGDFTSAINPNGINGAGDWTTATLTYIATADDAGQKIGIFLAGGAPVIGSPQTVWDNVRLTVELPATQAVPEPAGILLGLVAGLAFAVACHRRRR